MRSTEGFGRRNRGGLLFSLAVGSGSLVVSVSCCFFPTFLRLRDGFWVVAAGTPAHRLLISWRFW